MPFRSDISSILVIAGSTILAAGCGRPAPAEDALRADRLDQLRVISKACGLPEGSLTLRDGGRALLRPAPDTTYQNFACALAALEKAGFPRDKIGFVAEPPPGMGR